MAPFSVLTLHDLYFAEILLRAQSAESVTTELNLKMSANVLLENQPRPTDLSDLVEAYSTPLPKTEWMTRLRLDGPRRKLSCLPVATRISKRLVDIFGSLALIVVTAPLMITAAILVKLTSRGPVIYKQERVGLNERGSVKQDRRQTFGDAPHGQERRLKTDRRQDANYGRLFTIYKFRTMVQNAERNGAQFAQESDPRVTAVGKFFRRTRIDELPQLWNILKGDMSLVGPRPERPDFMDELSTEIPNYIDRLGLKPGLTGVAQVCNGYDNDLDGFRQKVAYDLLYLQNCCFTNDLKILIRTVRTVITGDGAL